MPMDIRLRNVNNPDQEIVVLYPHWEQVLKPQKQWVPIEEEEDTPVKVIPATKRRRTRKPKEEV